MAQDFKGVRPSLLLDQVRSTANWALESHPQADWTLALLRGAELDDGYLQQENRETYFRMLLAAHFCTVATFVPTDVDSHIRFHYWRAIQTEDELLRSVSIVDRIAEQDPTPVSARVVELADGTRLSGHEGEWLSVRAGALGRALEMQLDPIARAIAEKIDATLSAHASAFLITEKASGAQARALRVATTLAHNLGDLSRIVEQWPNTIIDRDGYRERYQRLGHPDRRDTAWGDAFVRAGHVNKAIMADENHRFLSLRKVKPLRRGRELLLPIGPMFDRWGATIAASSLLEDQDRAHVLEALVDAHHRAPNQAGYLRAISGLHQNFRGGLNALCKLLPTRIERAVAGGAIRQAIDVSEEVFLARLAKRYRDVGKAT